MGGEVSEAVLDGQLLLLRIQLGVALGSVRDRRITGGEGRKGVQLETQGDCGFEDTLD